MARKRMSLDRFLLSHHIPLKKRHQGGDLVHRTIPVLRRERIQCQCLYTRLTTSPNNGDGSLFCTLQTALWPASVAIHNDGDMTGILSKEALSSYTLCLTESTVEFGLFCSDNHVDFGDIVICGGLHLLEQSPHLVLGDFFSLSMPLPLYSRRAFRFEFLNPRRDGEPLWSTPGVAHRSRPEWALNNLTVTARVKTQPGRPDGLFNV